jgi:hypothetical protein
MHMYVVYVSVDPGAEASQGVFCTGRRTSFVSDLLFVLKNCQR